MFQFVIPTFNERENIEVLVGNILDLFEGSAVLVVDDNSPDGTGSWCESFAKSESRFDVLHRTQREGIGAATLQGLEWGLGRPFEWIVSMDGDISHDPKDLHERVKHLDATVAQVWIGSRYCAGGHIESWPWHRRLSSRAVNTVARTFLRVPVRDYSSAYRVYHRSALEAIELGDIKSPGYAYLEEILVKLHRNGVAMREFPICFNNRTEGKSKAGPRQIIRAVTDLTRIFFTRE